MTLQKFIEQLADFALQKDRQVPDFYRDCLLNYIAVTISGANTQAVDTVVKASLNNGEGHYQPVHRKEHVTLSDCILIDCFSSAIQAYDDIHFATTLHPCGPVASVIFGIARSQTVTLKQALNALMIGMEVECRMATLMLSQEAQAAQGWYPTGITGGIGATVAASRLYDFNKEQMIEAMALAATYASGTRGTHGSMAGSFVPAIAAKSGYQAANLIRHGFTCHPNALYGQNGYILQITQNPNIEEAVKDLGSHYQSMSSSCKPYPLGFISFAPIEACKAIDCDPCTIKRVELHVSSRVYMLGHNHQPKTQYDALVSLPYIVAQTLFDHERITIPLSDNFMIDDNVARLMERITLIEDNTMTDDEAKLMVEVEGEVLSSYCEVAPGSKRKPMSSDAIKEKVYKLIPEHAQRLIDLINDQDDLAVNDILNELN